MRIRKSWSCTGIIAVFFLVPLLALAQPPRGAAINSNQDKEKKKDASENLAPQDEEFHKVDPSQYVGANICKGCHEDEGASFERGPHGKTRMAKRQGPQWQGCEACHGPGKEHAESADPAKIIRFPSLSREEASRRCLGCHKFTEEHAKAFHTQHLKSNVGCVDCHSIHHPLVERKLLKATQPQLCRNCHLAVLIIVISPQGVGIGCA